MMQTNLQSASDGIAFILEIIVVRLDINDSGTKEALLVEANFNGETLIIVPSGINALEFKSGKSYEFVANPHALKEELYNNKLKLKLKRGNKFVGMCEMDWPAGILNNLTDNDCDGEFTNILEKDIMHPETNNKYGVIEFIVRLRRKCDAWNYNNECCPQENISELAKKIIDPHDVLFVVGDNENACYCSQVEIIPDSDSNKSLNATCLDLSSLYDVKGKTLPNTDVLAALDPGCCELKNLMESIKCKDNNPCCYSNDSYLDLIKSNSACNTSSDPNIHQAIKRCCSDEKAFAEEAILNLCHKECQPKLTVDQVPQKRCCPLCKENLSWLPKFASCPKCGLKQRAIPEETSYNVKITADEILKNNSNCTELSSVQSLSEVDELKPHGRCICKPNKSCAQCRIKKLCKDMFPSSSNKQVNISLSDICKSSSNIYRTHLSRLFSELKDIYHIPDKRKDHFKENEHCEMELNQGDVNKSSVMLGKELNEKHLNKYRGQIHKSDSERSQFLSKFCKDSSKVCKRKKIYDYHKLRKYPGIKIGHKTCIHSIYGRNCTKVPPNMGWLWNVETTGLRAGWKPGAIRKPIKELMRYFLNDFPADTLRVSQYSYRCTEGLKDDKEILTQKPTLHIRKKNGEYFITMRPLKDPESLRECADPYLKMKPIQFKIIKNPLLNEIRKIKQSLKIMGFRKCTCHKPIINCFCRSFLDKKRLEYQCNMEAHKRNLPPCSDRLVLSDTSDSDAEFDFSVTPSAGVIKPDRLNKPNLVNFGTQYDENDWIVPPMYPKEPNKYMKPYNCAIGERYGAAGFDANVKSGIYGSRGGFKGSKNDRMASGKGKSGVNRVGVRDGGKSNKASASIGTKEGNNPDKGKVHMMKYLKRSMGPKLSPAEINEKRKQRMRELTSTAPPLICMVDRRAKPIDPCAPCPTLPCCNDEACIRDSRIC